MRSTGAAPDHGQPSHKSRVSVRKGANRENIRAFPMLNLILESELSIRLWPSCSSFT